MRKWFLILMSLLLAVVLPFTALAEAPVVAKGNPLTFSTTTLDGKSISSSMISKYDLIMVNFWAEWCGPCVYELPALQQISRNYKNVLVLGAYVSSDPVAALETASQSGVTYPLFKVPYSLYDYLIKSSSGSGFSIPQTCFFNNKGYQLNSAYVGSRPYDSWAGIVEELLKYTATKEKKPVIKTQPSSVTAKKAKKVTFRVKASGTSLTYQWFYRASASGKWTKIPKATSAVWSFKAKLSQNGYQYRCLVKNSGGKVYTRAVRLKVKK